MKKQQLKADLYAIVDRAVEEGAEHGWSRVWKYFSKGDVNLRDDWAVDQIREAVMLSLEEVIRFN